MQRLLTASAALSCYAFWLLFLEKSEFQDGGGQHGPLRLQKQIGWRVPCTLMLFCKTEVFMA